MSIRSELNGIQLNRLDEMTGAVSLGEVLAFLLKAATATETGVTPSSDVSTLANIPSAVFQVNVTAGTTTGIKTLRKGVIGVDVPAAGEAVWQVGTKKIATAAADAASAVSVTYAKATDACSLLDGTA